MKRANNNNLLGVIQTVFYRCVSKVAQRGLRGSMQHITGKSLRVTDNILHPNSLDSNRIRIGDWFANHPPGIGSVLSQIRRVEGGRGEHQGAVSLNSIPSDSFIDEQLAITLC